MAFEYDLFVIGGGSGGIPGARQAAKYGAKVALAEQDALGGTCVNRGCVPKKLMVYASGFAQKLREAADYGWSPVESRFNWSVFLPEKDQEIRRLNSVYQQNLEKSGVTLFRDRAEFIDPHTLQVGDRTIRAEKILIAVGAHPRLPQIPGIEFAISSDDIFHLEHQPQHLAIIGGGYIGVEFACIMHGLGTQVSLLIRQNRILTRFDEDISWAVQSGMQARGIKILTHTEVKAIEKTSSGLALTTTDGSFTVDQVLAATGRAPNISKLGLERAGVKVEKGAIAVDVYSRTSVPHIFAVGDCIDRLNLTPVAIAQARAFADSEFGNSPGQISYEFIPTAIFAQPEAASVGLSEDDARQRYGDRVCCYCTQFRPLYYSLTDSDEKMLLKVVVNSETDAVLGIHAVGEHAAEMLQGFAVALAKGITKADLDRTIGIHPSAAEEFFTLRSFQVKKGLNRQPNLR
ncbi:MAG: glutathione-disulfide reductase [Desertifilum sp.]|nr:glutathione-disulfide reductase [Desertifilum sp.]